MIEPVDEALAIRRRLSSRSPIFWTASPVGRVFRAIARACRPQTTKDEDRAWFADLFKAGFERILREDAHRSGKGHYINFVGVDMASGPDQGVAWRIREDGSMERLDLKVKRVVINMPDLEAEIAAAPELTAEAKAALQRHSDAIIARIQLDMARAWWGG